MATKTYGTCAVCGVPLSRKGATHCRLHANQARTGTPAQREAARRAGRARAEQVRAEVERLHAALREIIEWCVPNDRYVEPERSIARIARAALGEPEPS